MYYMKTTRDELLARIKSHPRIDNISDEGSGRNGDGVWAYTKAGWCNGDVGTHTIHERTPSHVLRRLREIRPCQKN